MAASDLEWDPSRSAVPRWLAWQFFVPLVSFCGPLQGLAWPNKPLRLKSLGFSWLRTTSTAH